MAGIKTYLEFGSKDGDKKIPRDIREGQEAYDFFMVSRYLKDVIAYRTGNLNLIHHGEDLFDNIKKYAALLACKNKLKPLTYYEIGSSLMGVIDSLEHINQKFGELQVKDILFIGVDNSGMMNTVASYLYKDYKLALFEEKAIVPCDLFFAKGVSLLYAFEDEETFCNIIKQSRMAVFDYTFSLLDRPIKRFIGSGKPGTHLSLKKCKKLLYSKDKELILHSPERSHNIPQNSILYECVYGEKNLIREYEKELKSKKLGFKL